MHAGFVLFFRNHWRRSGKYPRRDGRKARLFALGQRLVSPCTNVAALDHRGCEAAMHLMASLAEPISSLGVDRTCDFLSALLDALGPFNGLCRDALTSRSWCMAATAAQGDSKGGLFESACKHLRQVERCRQNETKRPVPTRSCGLLALSLPWQDDLQGAPAATDRAGRRRL